MLYRGRLVGIVPADTSRDVLGLMMAGVPAGGRRPTDRRRGRYHDDDGAPARGRTPCLSNIPRRSPSPARPAEPAARRRPGVRGTGSTPPADTLLRQIFTGNAMVSLLSVVLAIVLGGILMAVTNPKVAATAGYFFARPQDMLGRGHPARTRRWSRGPSSTGPGTSFAAQIYPLTETLTVSTPLICAGLGVALAFRAGLFNIGAQGQIILGALFGAYVGFTWHLPFLLHLLVVIVAGLVGGAIWGGVVGLLKARTGAHEVIVTIMLQLHRQLPAAVPADHAGLPAQGVHEPDLAVPGRERDVPGAARSAVPPARGLPGRDRGDRLRLVAAEPLHARL